MFTPRLATTLLFALSALPAESAPAPQSTSSPQDYRSKIKPLQSNGTFDYIVIGGGTAGSVVAARLAEDPTLKVAVIEAGGFYEDNSNLSTTPAYWTQGAGTDPKDINRLVDWGFVSSPQTVSSLHDHHVWSTDTEIESETKHSRVTGKMSGRLFREKRNGVS